MRISTKGRYGARAMLELALNYEKGMVSIRDIAKRQDVSERYLERIMATLKAAGLVKSSQGAHGGYSLVTHPRNIRLSQVVQALEGPITVVPCVNDQDLCNRVNICITRDIWGRLEKSILEILDSITLQDMVEMQKEKLSTNS